ncbi:MAG: glycoside hydrolase family 20 protein [Bacteroides sp.]|nr:glycoside hydrolase family 20 protein [Bacteroides sp.]
MKRNLFISLYVVVLILAGSCSSKETTQAGYEVIPLPQKIEYQSGDPFALSSSTAIVYPSGDENLKRIAKFLSEYIQYSTGTSLTISEKQTGDNCIVLRSDFQHSNQEAYQLNVTDKQIIINGASAAGTFYGVQTLRKSIVANAEGKDIVFPQVTIEDYPRFGYRGMMLDIGRHMFPLDFIKEYIDIMALHNINRFHWHLTDDQGWRIEIKKYPELTTEGAFRTGTVIGRNSGEYDGKPYGGFYTQEEAKEIVAYAKDRFITVIPEIDLPGHMLAALTTYPHLGCTGGPYEVAREWGVFEDVLCAGNPETLVFLENVLAEIIEIFPSEYIHIGGDECPKVRWEKCPKCQAKIKELGLVTDKDHTAEQRLQSYVISHVASFLDGKGRKIIGWEEILEGGLASGATVMSWLGMEGAVKAARQKHDAIMVPHTHLYFDYYQTADTENVPLSIGGFIPIKKVYHFNPVPDELTKEEAKHIIGVQANLWTEYIPDSRQVEYMVMPRIDALSEVQWTEPDRKNYDSFLQRLLKMLKLYDKKGYNYSKSIFDLDSRITVNNAKRAIELTLSTIDNSPIYYTLDGSTPTENSEKYNGPLSFTETATVNALAFRPGIQTPAYKQSFNFNKATLKPITINQEPHKSYTFGGASTLVDGISGNKGGYKDGSWIGFIKDDVEIVIDLEENTEISEVELATYVHTNDWIFGPRSIDVSISEDGKKYTLVAGKVLPEATGNVQEVQSDKISLKPVQTRYVKITVRIVKQIPKWHPGAGNPAFIFMDEVRIQ